MLTPVPGVVCVAGHGRPPLAGGVHEVPCPARRVPQLLRQPVPRLPQVLSRQETHTQVGGRNDVRLEKKSAKPIDPSQ